MYDALLNKSGATGVFTDFPDTGVEFWGADQQAVQFGKNFTILNRFCFN